MKKYINSFLNEVNGNIGKVSWTDVAKSIKILTTVYEHGGRVHLIGNGGSSSIASHWANDLNKTVLGHAGHNNPSRRFQAIALTDNIPVMTAWANDVGYEHVFSEQLKNFIQDIDALIAISSSGNSPNIIKAAEFAKSYFVPVIGLVGFEGGKLKELADAAIHVPSKKYTIVEPVHSAVTHLITAYFYDWLRGNQEATVGF
ncbi:MAG: SIS domain-containing protein [Candidatus Brennerbacteria bacterium]|nr:SIS domain-containing protein [Candidatus Brennerbacteria bacterium]